MWMGKYTHTAEYTSSRLLGFTARFFMRVYVFESTWYGINCEREEGGRGNEEVEGKRGGGCQGSKSMSV